MTLGFGGSHGAMSQLNLSARGYYRVLKLARTIAVLAGDKTIKSLHLAAKLINESFIFYRETTDEYKTF